MQETFFSSKLPFLLRPKVNRYLRSKSGVFIPKKLSEEYLAAVEIFSKDPKRLDFPVGIKARFVQPDKRLRDLDNMAKALLDALQKSEVIVNDAYVYSLSLEKAFGETGETLVEISSPLTSVPHRKYCFDLPFLLRPKTNRYYRGKKKTFLPKDLEDLFEKAHFSIRRQKKLLGFQTLEGLTAVSLEVWVPDFRLRDLDNFFKGALDIMQETKIISNDKKVFELAAVKKVIRGERRTLLSVESL